MSDDKKVDVAKYLGSCGVIIEGQYYSVQDFPREDINEFGPTMVRKGVAYRYITDMITCLLPYRGMLDKHEKWNPYDSKVGFYLKKKKLTDGYLIKCTFPRTKEEKEEYAISREKNYVQAVLEHDYAPDQFLDLKMVATNGDAFMPGIRTEDDFLNKIMKLCIRMKEAPYDLYGKRIEAMCPPGSKPIEGTNMRNNNKRGLINNTTMSPTKYSLNSDVYQIETAIIVRDAPGAIDPILPNGEMLIMYPNGANFKIDPEKLVDATPLINRAIVESSGIENCTLDDNEEEN